MVHAELVARVRADALKARADLSEPQLTAIVAKVARLPRFRDASDFLTSDLIDIVHADFADIVRAVTVAHVAEPAAAPAPKPLAADEAAWRKLNPAEKLARHYEAEAGERPDIESEARAQRIASNHATPMDALQHFRETEAPPTRAQRFAKENPQVRTDDLAAITDPVKRHAAYRGRVADTRSIERLKLDQAAYQRKALDPNTPPSIRVAANLELARINERLKALNAA